MAGLKTQICGKLSSGVRTLALTFFALAFFLPIPQSEAAPQADEHTVLYYLVEMQRKYNRTCNGLLMDAAPSIIPSDSVRTLAINIAESGEQAQAVLGRAGLSSSPVFFTTVSGATPQQVFDNLKVQGCASMMSPSLKYIGAAPYRGAWYVLMTEREPDFDFMDSASGLAGDGVPASVLPPATTDPGVVPLLEERAHTPVVLEPPVAPAPVDSAASGIYPTPLPVTPSVPAPVESQAATPEPTSPYQAVPPATASVASVSSLPGLPGELLNNVNMYRSKGFMCGNTRMPAVPPLSASPILTATAQGHAEDMALRGYFASTSPHGVTLAERVESKGYIWANIAEVIVAVSPPAGMAVDTWLSRESQCQLLMSPDYTEAGVGYEPGKKMWVLTLAAPMPVEEGAIRLEVGRD